MARNNKRIDKPKNTRRKHTEYERHERTRFDVQAQVTSWPRVESRIYREQDVEFEVSMQCLIGNSAISQPYLVRFVRASNATAAAQLRPGDRIRLVDAVLWGRERSSGHQEIHAPRFEMVPDDPQHPNAWRCHCSLLGHF